MKKIILLSLFALLVIASLVRAELTQSQEVTATVVHSSAAYVYRNSALVDNNLIRFIETLGFNITKISESQIPLANLSKYQLIVIGDENFRKPSELKVGNYPSVVINHYNLYQFGLTDRDGGSILGATAPLNVMANNISVQVYSSAFRSDRVSANYIYLEKSNIAHNLQSVAFTQPTSSGKKFGTAIAYASVGTVLENGKTTKKNICFFGIKEAKLWTAEAKNLFRDCVIFAAR